MRQCQVCGSGNKEFVHRQAFARPQDDTQTHYDVVVCKDCGFAFADDIPSQAAQDEYYAESAHHAHAQQLPAGLAKIHREFFDFISAHVPLTPAAGILDVGSSMGHFLNIFRLEGFTDIQGLDPSPGVDRLAHEAYGLRVFQTPLGDFPAVRRFDLITLCGVLEHIVEAKDWMQQVLRLLSPGGHVFIAVPDAARFGDKPPREPFLEFAHEHINFFTPQSLRSLLLPLGFSLVCEESRWNDFYGNHYLLALFRFDESPVPAAKLSFDDSGPASLRRYVAQSNARQEAIEAVVAPLVQNQTPIAVWGTGALASRLCATTSLRKARIVTFLDSNPQMHGRSFLNRPIQSPASLKSSGAEAVLIASYVYADEIRRILEDMCWRGQIVVLP